MSELRVFHDGEHPTPAQHSTDAAEIAAWLSAAGVRFEQWRAEQPVAAGASPAEVMAAYRADIDRLIAADGYQTVDVISLAADHPDKAALRQKFLSEHTHSEDEVRFFVDGRGLFSLHIGTRVYEVLCEKGDLISVPANTPHWFDMGPQPRFIAIRFFNDPAGWVAHYTGSTIADRFSRLD
jgi:1,2-dihydroxy-3-keto-5-methylthiopentene dioxygenase